LSQKNANSGGFQGTALFGGGGGGDGGGGGKTVDLTLL
tara:strand:+ start:4774 stop:4887 length:114 start_codon:yes stop_codon:yes gene_type:complete